MTNENISDSQAFLEELMDTKRLAAIKFRTVEGAVAEIRAHIVSVETVSERVMIDTDAGFSIGIDQLIEVNGRQFANIC